MRFFLLLILFSNTLFAQSVGLNQITLSNYAYSNKVDNRFVAKILTPTKNYEINNKNQKYFIISGDSVFLTNKGARRLSKKKKVNLPLTVRLPQQKAQQVAFTIVLDEFSHNKVIAHRGAWKTLNFPPNSLAALNQALKLGYEGSEFDVHLTADNVLVVNHDPDFEGLRIEKSTYNQLLQKQLPNGEKIPTLEAFIKAGIGQQHTKLILEIKPSVISKERSLELTNRVVNMVQRLQAQAWIHYISFDYDVLKRVLQIEPSATVAYLEGRYSPRQLKNDGMSGADYYYSVYQNNSTWIDEAHKLGLTINAWTVNDPEIMKWLLVSGADYITTNEPEELLKLVKETPLNKGWKLVWADEFNYKGLPDSSKWNYDIGGEGWGNNEKQYYSNADTLNAKVNNGMLSIIARKQKTGINNYTSARLTTKDRYSVKYGRIEVRAKMPKGKGLWPAIWMLPGEWKYGTWPKSGEIDIVEAVGFEVDTIHGSIHTGSFNHIQNTQKTQEVQVPDLYSSFHTYAVEWQPNKIDFFVDDKKYMSFVNSNKTSEEWPFDQDFYLLLNLAVGGDWGGKKGIDDEIFPAEMQIDYVRVFKNQE